MRIILKWLIILLVVLSISKTLTAQTAKDVLEYGVLIKSGEKIFFQYDNKALKFDISKSLTDIANPLDFTTLPDSIIFLVTKNEANIYLFPPLNPLNNTCTTIIKEIPDPINEAASKALSSVIDILKSTKTSTPSPRGQSLESNFAEIQSLMEDNQKEAINSIFNELKELSFLDETSTIEGLTKCKTGITEITTHFNKIDTLINNSKKLINKLICNDTNCFFRIYIYNSILRDFKVTAEEQNKRLDNLLIAYKLVKRAQEDASKISSTTGLKWCQKLPSVSSKEGKVSIYSITIKENGYKLSDKNEIVSIESNEILKRTVIVRKFQRFVPEVSVGTAYTFFKYPTYGTTSDSSGVKTSNMYVASPTENMVRNLNISTMVNFNYFITNSPIHPLYQIGLGINSGLPTLLTGVGLRSNINGLNRLAITGGIAMTWVKELDKLKVGDKISGTTDIDKDLKYQFSWPPKLYIGLQYHF